MQYKQMNFVITYHILINHGFHHVNTQHSARSSIVVSMFTSSDRTQLGTKRLNLIKIKKCQNTKSLVVHISCRISPNSFRLELFKVIYQKLARAVDFEHEENNSYMASDGTFCYSFLDVNFGTRASTRFLHTIFVNDQTIPIVTFHTYCFSASVFSISSG